MNYPRLRKLNNKVYFGIDDLVELLKIRPASARVLGSRYVRNGFFTRIKRNFYVLSEAWDKFDTDDFLKVSNFLQTPSYISFLTALSIYNLTTQVQQNFIESACLKRSVKINISGAAFNYYKIKKELYFGFIKKDGIFIATKEKALLDSLYLYSFGKYRLDFNAISFNKFNKGSLKGIMKLFPDKTQRLVKRLCKI
jgi:predicted transcriptional regulator of viral defense system